MPIPSLLCWILFLMNNVVNVASAGADVGDSDDDLDEGLFNPFDFGAWRLFGVCLIIVTFGSLAAGAGIGGGGLFVPIYSILLTSDIKSAVPLSNSTIFGAAIGNFLVLAPRHHPTSANPRPLIDYESCTFMQAGELLGVIFGVLLNIVLPQVFIIVFLFIVLGWNAVRTWRKGLVARGKETLKKSTSQLELMSMEDCGGDDGCGSGTTGAITTSTPGIVDATLADKEKVVRFRTNSAGELGTPRVAVDAAAAAAAAELAVPEGLDLGEDNDNDNDNDKDKDKDKATLFSILVGPPPAPGSVSHSHMLAKQSRQYPPKLLLLLLLMTGYTLLYALLKTNKYTPCGSRSTAVFWTWYFSPVLVLGLVMYIVAVYLHKLHLKRVSVNWEYLTSDMQWTAEKLRQFPVTSVFAGVTAGLLGIGGGMIIGPLFISVGMQPQVGTASCAFMILFTR